MRRWTGFVHAGEITGLFVGKRPAREGTCRGRWGPVGETSKKLRPPCSFDEKGNGKGEECMTHGYEG